MTHSSQISLSEQHSKQPLSLIDLSFDLIQKYIFKDLELPEIISICLVNKEFYSRCQKSHLYWKNYLYRNFGLREKSSNMSWFEWVKHIYRTPYSVWSLKAILLPWLELKEVKTIKKRGNYVFYSPCVQISSCWQVRLYLQCRKKFISPPGWGATKGRYTFKPPYKFKKALLIKNQPAGMGHFHLIAIDLKNNLYAYKIDIIQGKITHSHIGLLLERVQDIVFPYRDDFWTQKKPSYVLILSKDNLIYRYPDGYGYLKELYKTPVAMKEIAANGSDSLKLIDFDGRLWIFDQGQFNLVSHFLQGLESDNTVKFKTIYGISDVSNYFYAITSENKVIAVRMYFKTRHVIENGTHIVALDRVRYCWLGIQLPPNAILPQMTSENTLIFKSIKK